MNLKTTVKNFKVHDLASEHMASLVEEDLELQLEQQPSEEQPMQDAIVDDSALNLCAIESSSGDSVSQVAIIDYQFINLCAIGGQFQSRGIEYETFEQGDFAIQRIKELIERGKPIFKMMVIDYSMPEMNGPQTAAAIVQLCADASIPKPYMICCTAYTEDQFRDKAIAAGMEDFQTKPIPMKVID